MKQPNVEGLREIIHLASLKKTKCLALLSTISVYSWGHIFTGKTVMREDDDIAQNLLSVSKDIGYVRSKWGMEAIADLAEKQGLPLINTGLAMRCVTVKVGPVQHTNGGRDSSKTASNLIVTLRWTNFGKDLSQWIT